MELRLGEGRSYASQAFAAQESQAVERDDDGGPLVEQHAEDQGEVADEGQRAEHDDHGGGEPQVLQDHAPGAQGPARDRRDGR
jgi:hypothetical protein